MSSPAEMRDTFVRYANGVIGLLPFNADRVRERVNHVVNWPRETAGYPIERVSEYYSGSLETLQSKGFGAALLGMLDTKPDSLAELFRVEDGIKTELGMPNRFSVEGRLDLCILAAASAAINLITTGNEKREDKPKSPVQLAQKPGITIARINLFQRPSRLYLDDARHIQRIALEAGPQQAVDVGITPVLQRYKDDASKKFQRDHPEHVNEEYTSQFKKMRMSNDDIYSYFLRQMLDSIKNGYRNQDDYQSPEQVMLLYEAEGCPQGAELTALLVSYAFMNKARRQLSEDAYGSPFFESEEVMSRSADDAVIVLTKANGLMTARIPFLVDLNRITPNYSDVRDSILGKILRT